MTYQGIRNRVKGLRRRADRMSPLAIMAAASRGPNDTVPAANRIKMILQGHGKPEVWEVDAIERGIANIEKALAGLRAALSEPGELDPDARRGEPAVGTSAEVRVPSCGAAAAGTAEGAERSGDGLYDLESYQ